MTLPIEVEREADGRWLAEIPDLPGILAYGDTPFEAFARAHSLGLRAVVDRIENGEMIPPADPDRVDTPLAAILRYLERETTTATVAFLDGESYDLRINSTMHEPEGGDVIAEILRVLSSPTGTALPPGSFISIRLDEIDRVVIDGVLAWTVEA